MSESAERSASLRGAKRLRVELDSGGIVIEPSADDALAVHLSTVEEGDDRAAERVIDSRVFTRGDEVIVEVSRRVSPVSRSKGLQLLVQLPEGCALVIQTGSADLQCSARPGDVRISTGSGDLSMGHILGSTSIDTGSGELFIDTIGGDFAVKTGSGGVQIRRTERAGSISTGSGEIQMEEVGGSTQVKVGSGNVSIERAHADLRVATASGSLHIRRAEGRRVSAETASGDLSIGIPDGTRAWLDVHTMSGSIRSELEAAKAPAEGDQRIEVRARSISGDVQLLRA